ncbi:MAG: hypothetical protein OEZ10_08300 [Gammaproteobacteria bacterium]|nr:hypothetical protein [Gammaproteobacteria bacterium]
MAGEIKKWAIGLAALSLSSISGIAGAATGTVAPSELDRVTNFQGSTGLFWMNTAYTLGIGELRATAMGSYDNVAITPVYDSGTDTYVNYGPALILYTPVSVALGLTETIEVSGLAKSYSIDYDNDALTDETGAGDTEGAIKWNFSSQTENLPALAAIFTFVAATGDKDKDRPFRQVEEFGIKGGFAASTETIVGNDTPIGFHLEVEAVLNDPLSDTSNKKEKHSFINAGFVVPLSDDHLLVAIAEVSRLGNANTTLAGYNRGEVSEQTTSTIGIRYTWKYINAGLAAQSVDSAVGGISTHRRALATVGIGF